MRIVHFTRCYFSFVMVLLCAAAAFPQHASTNILYAGVMLSGGHNAEVNFPRYHRNKLALAQSVAATLQTMNDAHAFPFTLVLSTDVQSRKEEISDTFSLAIVVTRDDITTESLKTADVDINKLIVNVGLDAVVYETARIDGVAHNSVLYSFPLVGYSQSIARTLPSDDEIDRLFLTTAHDVLKDYLAKQLQQISLRKIHGTVTRVSQDNCRLDIGAVDGLDLGQNVTFFDGNTPAFCGKVLELDSHTAGIQYSAGKKPTSGMQVSATNMKGFSDNTYQVVDVKISSSKAAQMFPVTEYGAPIAEWFSNFLANRAGKIVMPSRVGGEWDASATDNAFKLLDMDDNEHLFELPPPKYPISLDVTGIATKIGQSNAVNDVVIYKAWMKVSIPTSAFSQEFDATSSRVAVNGILAYADKAEFYDLLYKLTEKISREGKL